MLKQLEKKLHEEIPLTKLMKLKVNTYNEKELITSAPLNVNINDKGTAFGGSLSTITIISAWSICWLISKELEIDSKNIVIIKNENSYLKPVRKDIICYTQKPSKEEISILKEKINSKGSASLKIKSKIIEDNKVCVEFEGIYVIKL
ncbi:thioesterase domain-containing protein [Poseidonibacter lekithochrous]|uniref:YiiD C-terminal domain-containing protein n=1 Tax=Poseidonibacter TaxID=2321187 RepID=UPI001C0A458C|nr:MULTISPECIES: YiiD C-terminal domain-containing protein [Poseidonibacter]MBU3015163.1 thioesterase domain-containing protein [Poseidonibacter lekithochrous]MDO6828460.1 YiiD C-terminal domain-containing protein [Poseidonibacter sp. 1_MG-2023]